jgi:hypothetical protein
MIGLLYSSRPSIIETHRVKIRHGGGHLLVPSLLPCRTLGAPYANTFVFGIYGVPEHKMDSGEGYDITHFCLVNCSWETPFAAVESHKIFRALNQTPITLNPNA